MCGPLWGDIIVQQMCVEMVAGTVQSHLMMGQSFCCAMLLNHKGVIWHVAPEFIPGGMENHSGEYGGSGKYGVLGDMEIMMGMGKT